MKTDKLREMSHLRKKAHATMLKKKSKVYAAFLKMEEAAYCAGQLESKVKELIAVGNNDAYTEAAKQMMYGI
jgi:hypothetical protein